MAAKIGINGFGRMGRLFMRAGWGYENLEITHINDPGGEAESFAHLMNFDSVHGRWNFEAIANGDFLEIDGKTVGCSQNQEINETDWSECDIVVEASGQMKKTALLQGYIRQGVDRVVATCPIREEGVLNVVIGVNHLDYDASQHTIVTASSCTTNCLAPVVKVLQENLGIRHGSMTTIHSVTNTQRIVDRHHSDLRRARTSGVSLIPTTTGSARAITDIFPELKGRLNGHAVRIPLANASLTDCVFELETSTTVEEVNALFKDASERTLAGILGYEERPLVSIDYKTDSRSGIVDALSTMVVNGTQLKVYVWYDNEWGYSNRVVDLVNLVTKHPS